MCTGVGRLEKSPLELLEKTQPKRRASFVGGKSVGMEGASAHGLTGSRGETRRTREEGDHEGHKGEVRKQFCPH